MKLPIEEIESYPLLFDLFDESDPPSGDLAERGLLPPLPVLVSEEGRFLAWGKTAIEAAKARGRKEVEAAIYGLGELSRKEAFLVALAMENRKGRFSRRELDRIAAEAERLGADDEETEARVGAEGCLKAARRRLALPRLLGDLAARDSIDLKTAESVSSLPEGLLKSLAPILEAASFSERRIFLKSLDEVLKRDGGGANREAALAEMLLGSERPLEKLRAIRYPELAGLEERLRAVSAKRLKGSGISLKPPPFFEGSRFSVSFEFASPAQLAKKADLLKKLAEEDGDELFSLL